MVISKLIANFDFVEGTFAREYKEKMVFPFVFRSLNRTFAPDMEEKNQYVRQVAEQKYEFGFTTDVQTEVIPVGLNEDIVRLISKKKNEPEWMLEFRLTAFRHWQTMKQPTWGHVKLPEIDYQAISYYADPTAKKPVGDGKIDPELEKTFDKLGIPLEERLALSGNTAVDAIMDSVSVYSNIPTLCVSTWERWCLTEITSTQL